MEYDNKNTGVLFKNAKKKTDKHPDYTGTYTDGAGKEHWLSSWIKTDKNGNKYMSLSTTPKDARGEESQDTASEFGEIF